MPPSDPVLTGDQEQSNHTAQLRNRLWRNVASSTLDNIFSLPSAPTDLQESPLQDTRYTVDRECRQKLQAALGEPFGAFPPTEVLNDGLDLFFHHYNPSIPLIHLPTFSVKSAPPLLLYTMCLIGLVMLGTPEALAFVRRSFLVRVSPDSMECTLIIFSPSYTKSRLNWPDALYLPVMTAHRTPYRSLQRHFFS